MLKRIFLFVILSFSYSGLFSQENIKNMVAVVRPVYTESSKKFLRDFSKSLKRDGYFESSKVLESYIEGGFGSGLLYFDKKTGRSYVVTNRHVVAQAATATIELLIGDEIVTFKNCEVSAADENLELALIAIPDTKNLKYGFKITDRRPADGTEVFTGGYPALSDEPSWQLGHGIISNNSVHNKTLLISDSLRIIQHTAQIDAGSSGGPLMISNAASPGGYDVIGINTWKAEGRENANFAIPGSAINSFIKKALKSENDNYAPENLKSAAELFASATQKGYKKVLPFISSEYISNVSVNGFYDLFNAISDTARSIVLFYFSNGHPVDGVRIALADAICEKYGQKNLRFSSMEEFVSPLQEPVAVLLKNEEKYVPTVWNMEQGMWKLQNVPALRLNDLDKGGVSKTFGYPNSLKLGIDVPMNNDVEGTQYKIIFERTVRTFFTYGIALGMGSMDLLKHGDNYRDTIPFSKNYFSTDVLVGLQLPVKVSSVYIIPNVKGFFGMNFGEETGGMNYGFSVGTEVAYKLTNKTYLLGGLSFKRRFIITQDYDFFGDDSKFAPYSLIGVHLGITW